MIYGRHEFISKPYRLNIYAWPQYESKLSTFKYQLSILGFHVTSSQDDVIILLGVNSKSMHSQSEGNSFFSLYSHYANCGICIHGTQCECVGKCDFSSCVILLGVNSKSMHSHRREIVFHCMCLPCVWQQICAIS